MSNSVFAGRVGSINLFSAGDEISYPKTTCWLKDGGVQWIRRRDLKLLLESSGLRFSEEWGTGGNELCCGINNATASTMLSADFHAFHLSCSLQFASRSFDYLLDIGSGMDSKAQRNYSSCPKAVLPSSKQPSQTFTKTLQSKNQIPIYSPIMATSCTRSFLSSTSFRTAASRLLSSQPKPARSSFRLPKQTPLTNCIFRAPVEMSCAVESLMPFHTATASALLTSMLSIISRPCYSLLPEGNLFFYSLYSSCYRMIRQLIECL
ncbi:hypothetical protein IFM89_031741 [Coptis chinensis]|uniref:Uncharacterized protein n=1 Tax=Coptis chinensis TaxID=261450 RepID=A0A835LF43_9MAGN|nr:hypothetical protein IFM89_031741 [Coptis chinensis]